MAEHQHLFSFETGLSKINYHMVGNIGGVKFGKSVFTSPKFYPPKFYTSKNCTSGPIASDFELVRVENGLHSKILNANLYLHNLNRLPTNDF